uniref:Uncharacterized protein n=1 Tax=Utricularia reniformis TaxID=192314 RepID=A0A1Y0B341_9LAMI|nr:hypothetical protein AEK19_MT1673 [Utricularia reniformis]ART31855.1 hypothetical protein AEK19_MT1673 [Utricularia reniformis]
MPAEPVDVFFKVSSSCWSVCCSLLLVSVSPVTTNVFFAVGPAELVEVPLADTHFTYLT